jgi:phospholipid/cholesterol/gamma-HCH transport system substrate-binding protein
MADQDDDVPPPPSSRGRNRELWVGLFVLVGLIGGLSVLFVMTEPAMLRGRYFISTDVPDAGGIRKGDSVRMLGVVIGRVTSFKIDRGRVAVRMEIEGEYKLPRDSKAVIKSKSLLGEMVADIVPGTSTETLAYGGSIPGELEVGVLEEGDKLSDKASEVMTRAQRVLSDATIQNVEAGTTELRGLLDEMNKMAKEQRGELSALSKSLRRSAEGIEGAATRPELQNAIKKTEALMARMDTVTISLDRSSTSLETVMTRLEKGEGSLGKLLKDEELYKNLNEAVLNTNKLLIDFREHPKRYVKLSFF